MIKGVWFDMKINPSCWSEHDELKKVIVCSPSILDIPDQQTAKDVQWEKPVDQKKAQKNFEDMVRAMEQEGVEVIDYSKYLSPKDLQLNDQLINRIFVRDLACVFGNTILPGEAGTSMRRPEYFQLHLLFQKWFDEKVFPIQANNNLKALEYGDVFVLNKDAIFINTGTRTSIESIERIKDQLFEAGFSEIGIIDLPRQAETMHLDMNCNVAGSDLLLAKSYMRFFPVRILTNKSISYQMMQEFLTRHGFEVEWTNEVKHTVADINFLNINPQTLLVSSKANKKIFKQHPKLQNKNIIEVEVDELEKGGGGIRCMTLPLERVTT